MGFTIPGFPKQVSDVIEMPNIAELLMYPMFQLATPECVRKYGTEFQKKLLEMTPLKGNQKYISILSYVSIIYPGLRAMTSHTPSTRKTEWHIDGEIHRYQNPTETFHLLTSECTSMTEFNSYPIEMEIPPHMSYIEMINLLESNPKIFPVEPGRIEAGRIYTFENHLHQATPPKSVEFRYTWRIHETDMDKYYLPGDEGLVNGILAYDINHQSMITTIRRNQGELHIPIPSEYKIESMPNY
jgi:hypothetical protein